MKWKFLFAALFVLLLSVAAFDFSRAADVSPNVTTSVITRESILTLAQSDYRWYENLNSLTPTTALAGENATTTTPNTGTILRLRMNVLDSELALSTGATFNLQYATSSSGPWTNFATSTAWIFADNSGVADGQIITDLKLTTSDVVESYSESNPTAATPNAINPGEKGEWDWVIRNSSADTESDWFFRMIYSSSTALDTYTRYPQMSAQTPAAPEAPPASPSSRSGGGGGGTGFFQPPLPPGLAIPPPFLPPELQVTDCNADSRVDIVDLSIMLFYYGQSGPFPPCTDLNLDGIVNFPDVSILMFYWTG